MVCPNCHAHRAESSAEQQQSADRITSGNSASSSSTDETVEVVAQVDLMLQDSWERLKKDLKKELPEDQVQQLPTWACSRLLAG